MNIFLFGNILFHIMKYLISQCRPMAYRPYISYVSQSSIMTSIPHYEMSPCWCGRSRTLIGWKSWRNGAVSTLIGQCSRCPPIIRRLYTSWRQQNGSLPQLAMILQW